RACSDGLSHRSPGVSPGGLDHRLDLPGLWCAKTGALQLRRGRTKRCCGRRRGKELYWLSHHSCSRSDCVDHPLYAVARGGRASTGAMEMGPAATDALSFVHDVQPFSLSKFQGGQLENEKIHPALSYH